ncbi:hypothetical protein ATC03_00485 [Agromyces aureus]|uniref:HTH gntR-type domain-containing protein n=2 Tax=Agromyces aureus TaxID=453304 RepID=A0A191WB37_9MICO|nr:hypothetical protein ATC03_00485 [Agromyces aureus]
MDGPLLAIDRLDERPVVAQIVDAMRRAILTGALQPGDRVASTRLFAAELGTARSSVVSAYEQLAGEGYLELRQGAPTLVAPLGERSGGSWSSDTPADGPSGITTRPLDTGHGTADAARRRPPAASATLVEPALVKPTLANADRGTRTAPERGTGTPQPARPPRIDLLPGRPSTARIDERAWRSAWRRAAAVAVPVDDPPRLGEPALRAAIADHVRHARGFACEPDDIVVTAGTSEATSLIGTALHDLLGTRPLVAVEDPGYPNARRMLERAGAELAPVAVGDDGLRVELLRTLPRTPDAILVTPSHQYPLGGRLPVAARLELLEYARRAGALVLEDDYDSEFRHVGAPIPTLASLDATGAKVVLIGSFSKVLTPWLRLGYAVLPRDERLRAAVEGVRAESPSPVAGVVQHAVAHLLTTGAVRRHIAATTRDYAHRRRLVLAAIGDLPGTDLVGLDGGLHAVLRLPRHDAVDAVLRHLAGAGIVVARLADYSAVTADGLPGIVLGYAGVGDRELGDALGRIRAAVLASR